MTATTIKVPSDLRDRLNAEAQREGITVAGVIERLIAESERVERFRQIRLARDRMTVDDRTSYEEETALWDRVSDEDLATADPQ
jgi:predicted DNA-binding protein